MTEHPEPTLTVAEVADRLNLRLEAVRRMIASGDLSTDDGRISVAEFETFRRAVMDAMVAHYADDIEADLYGDSET